MDIHSAHFAFAVALNHAEAFPTVPLVEAGVVSDEVNGGDAFASQVGYDHVEKLAGDSLAAVGFLGVDRANIGGEILAVVEVVFDDAHAGDDHFAIKSKVPAELSVTAEVGVHALKIGLFWDAPLIVKPLGGGVLKVGALAEGDIGVVFHV